MAIADSAAVHRDRIVIPLLSRSVVRTAIGFQIHEQNSAEPNASNSVPLPEEPFLRSSRTRGAWFVMTHPDLPGWI
jgi:hypothetical protein